MNFALSCPDPYSAIATAIQLLRLASWSRCLRDRHRYSGQAQQVACCHGELELQINPSQATKHRLPNPTHCLRPTEVFFDALAHDLAQSITGVPGGAPVDRTAAAPRVVLSKMRSHATFAAGGDKVDGVKSFVASQ